MKRFRRYLLQGSVLSAYLVLSLLHTWPLAAVWRTHVLGGRRMLYDDIALNVWNIWWVRWATEHGLNPFWTSMLYHPQGSQMYVQTLNSMSALLTLPVSYMAGPIAAYNTALVLAFVLTGYGGYLLLRAFDTGHAVAFVCGALLAFSPYMTLRFDNGHLNLIGIQWIPLYFLALTYVDRYASWRAAAAAAAAFLCATLTDLHWALFCGTATLVWIVAQTAFTRQRRRLLRGYLRLAVLLLLCLAPLSIGILSVAGRLPVADERIAGIWEVYNQGYSADALGLLFPALHNPWWGDAVADLLATTQPGFGPNGWYVAAGSVLLACAALGVWRCWREQRHLLVVMAALWVLSLGPSLRIGGLATGLPLPYALLAYVPVVSLGRRPSHFAVVPLVLATVFAGLGLSTLLRRRAQWQRRCILAAIGAVAAVELAHPAWQARALEHNNGVQLLRARPGAVADLPYEAVQAGGRSIRNQLVHEQPILGGFVSRQPHYPTIKSPLIQPLAELVVPPTDDIVARDQAALATMQCFYNIRHILLRKDLVTPQQRRNLETFLAMLSGSPLTPGYDDARQLWYELPLYKDRCQPFVFLSSGWHKPEVAGQQVKRWSTADSQVVVVNPFKQPIMLNFSLRGQSPLERRWIELVGEQGQLARWPLEQAERRYLVSFPVAPGTHVLTLQTATSPEAHGNRELGVLVTSLSVDGWSVLAD